MRFILRSLLIAGVLLSFSACSKETVLEAEMQRSVLIYMAANNDLSPDMINNINALKRGFLPSNGNILIYLDVPNANPKLFRLVRNISTNAIEEELIEQYAEDERSTNPAVLTRSLKRMRELFPAKSYGLILSSHATGWVPAGMLSSPFLNQQSLFSAPAQFKIEDLPTTRAFGAYGNDPGMELSKLAAAIPFTLSFILFDACFMGSIEVAYALRNVTDYIIASPTEVLSTGFPFDQIMQPLFQTEPDLMAVCNAFYHFYNDHPSGEAWQSATIALYATASIEVLATKLKSIFQTHRTDLNTFLPDEVQHYANAPIFYDLEEFILQLAPTEVTQFKAALDNVVQYKCATDSFFSLVTKAAYIPVHYYGGISTYIPVAAQSALRNAYKETAWNRAVGMVE